jgi:hypothetical protein
MLKPMATEPKYSLRVLILGKSPVLSLADREYTQELNDSECIESYCPQNPCP